LCSLDITNTIDSLLLHYPNFCRLHLEILPLQLHLDQEQLNFLINFFTNDSCNNDPHLHCENETVDVKSTSNGSNTVVDEALLPFFQVFHAHHHFNRQLSELQTQSSDFVVFVMGSLN